MKVYAVEYFDGTINKDDSCLGVYDSEEKAKERAKRFSEKYIRSDDKGPLGKTAIIEIEVNEDMPGCAAEGYEMMANYLKEEE